MGAAAKIISKLVGLTAAVAVAGGGFAWWQYRANESQRIIEAQAREIEYLNNVADRLDMERRVARIIVTGQKRNDKGQLVTDLLFFEVGRDGEELAPKSFTVVGDEIRVGGRIIKFNKDFVREGDPLRGKAILLWDRIYGSATAPENAQLIDPEGKAPRIYRGDPAASGLDATRARFEAELWDNFWELAKNPELAESKGVRAMHGVEGYAPFEPDYVYELTLENNGALTLYSKPMPALYRALLQAVGNEPGDPTAAPANGVEGAGDAP